MSRPNAAVWALTLLALVGCRRAPPGRVAESTEPSLFRVAPEKRAHLEVVTAAETPVTLPVDVPAVVNFDELKTSRVVPLVSGRVASVLVHEGDRVKAGQALMTIASPDASDTRASLTRNRRRSRPRTSSSPATRTSTRTKPSRSRSSSRPSSP